MSKIEMEELKKTAAEIAENLSNKNTTFENIEEILDNPFVPQKQVKTIKRVNFQKSNNDSNINSEIKEISTDFFTFGSVNIPKQTLYLVVALTVIAIIIWYMSNKKDKEKQEKQKNQKQLFQRQMQQLKVQQSQDSE